MEKILIIGSSGSGKSTFAEKLANKTGVELIHLDALYYDLKGNGLYNGEWERAQSEMVKKEKWIIDGNFFRTINIRLKEADTVILFDFPKLFSLYRNLKRFILYRNNHRPDMPASFKEDISLSDIKKILLFNSTRLLDQIKNNSNIKKIIIFKNNREADQYLFLNILPNHEKL